MMKTIKLITVIVLFAGISKLNAQTGHGHMMYHHMMQDSTCTYTGNMMHPHCMTGYNMTNMGMMHHMLMNGSMCPYYNRMMKKQQPLKRYTLLIQTLPDMKNKLSLSLEQTENLIDIRAGFMKQKIDFKAQLAKENLQLNNLLENNASVSDVRKQLEKCSIIKTNMKVTAYETAGKMKDLLTNTQKEKLANCTMQFSQYNNMMFNQN